MVSILACETTPGFVSVKGTAVEEEEVGAKDKGEEGGEVEVVFAEDARLELAVVVAEDNEEEGLEAEED